MPLAAFADPNWQADQPIDYGQGYTAQQAQIAAQPTPQAMAPEAAPIAAPVAPPVGVGYTAPMGGAGGIPAPPAMNGMSAEEAIKLARQGAGRGQAAGFTPTTRSETLEGKQASPEYQQATADKLGADADANVAQYNADAAVGAARGQADQRLALNDEIQRRDAEARAQQTQAKLAYDRDHINQLMKQATQPSESAEHKYWGDKSTFGKVATGLSMVLKGFVFGATGRGDPAEWLNQQISQTAEDQRMQSAKAKDAVGNAMTLYGFNKESLGDEDRAKLATEAALRQQVIGMLDRRVGEAAANPLEQLRAAQLKKTLADQNAATLEQFWDKTADKHTNAQASAYHPATGGGAQDPLTLLRRSREIQKTSNELTNDTDLQTQAQNLQKGQLDLRKGAAETTKTEIEAEKLKNESKTSAGAALGAEDVKSTAYSPLRNVQGTDANANSLGIEKYNALLLGSAAKAYGPRVAKDIVGSLAIQPGDTEATIAIKKQHAAALFGAQGASSIPGVQLGVAPDDGAP